MNDNSVRWQLVALTMPDCCLPCSLEQVFTSIEWTSGGPIVRFIHKHAATIVKLSLAFEPGRDSLPAWRPAGYGAFEVRDNVGSSATLFGAESRIAPGARLDHDTGSNDKAKD